MSCRAVCSRSVVPVLAVLAGRLQAPDALQTGRAQAQGLCSSMQAGACAVRYADLHGA